MTALPYQEINRKRTEALVTALKAAEKLLRDCTQKLHYTERNDYLDQITSLAY